MAMNSKHINSCLVCTGPAIGINFGVPTCAPCKAFFRRNAVKLGTVDFVCRRDGDCPLTFTSRRICSCCRLAQCFRVGMQKSLILTEVQKEARKDLVQQNREKRAQLAKAKKTTLIRPSTISRITQNKSKHLKLSDQVLLTNIFAAFNKTYTLPDGGRYQCFPSVECSSIHTLSNQYAERHKSFIEYCKLIPEFHQLSMRDKKSLLQNHFVETIVLGNQTLANFHQQNLTALLQNVFEPISANGFIKVVERLTVYMYDPLLLKLVLIIQALSNGSKRFDGNHKKIDIYDDPLAIFASQNVYVELLWRYLLSRLSSERYAVKLFNRLVLDLLFLQQVSFIVERYVARLDDEIEKMNPLMQSLWII